MKNRLSTSPQRATAPAAGPGRGGGGAPRRHAMAPSAATARKKILIIDDDPGIVAFFTALFRENGYDTCSAGDGEEALARCRDERPDLVTLDIAMPKAWGPRFLQSLEREGLTPPPVIVVSGMGQARHAVPGARAVLNKPADPATLLRAVREVLG